MELSVRIQHKIRPLCSQSSTFRTLQCDLHLDLDCTNYLLYDFPDELDVEIYEALRADDSVVKTYDQQRLQKAFCIYLDG